MREILFRAWVEPKNGLTMRDKDGNILGNHMEYGVPIVDGKYASIDNYGELYGLEDYILMQYTGLTDKNGVKIYEGDICKIFFVLDDIEDHIWLGLTKEEKDTQSKIFIVEDPLLNFQEEFTAEKIEVIGNIYQHPHLIP